MRGSAGGGSTRRTRTRPAAALASLLVLVLAASVAPPARADGPATYVVDDDGAGAVGNCDASTPASSSIAAAVALAPAGSTILVCPGSYPGSVQVDKALDVEGAQAGRGIVGRSDPAAESVVPAASGGFTVTAGPTSIRGFTFNGTSPNPAVQVTGAALAFSDNLVRGRRTGVDVQDGVGTTVTSNAFSHTVGLAVDVSGGAVSVVGNRSTGDAGLLRARGTAPVDVLDNVVGDAQDSAVELTGASTARIEANRLLTARTAGVTVDGGSRGVHITSNSISTGSVGIQVPAGGLASPLIARANRLVGNTSGGIVAAAGGTPVSAEDNWWGCNTGPGSAGCDSATGPVNSPTWLVLRVTAAPGSAPVGADVHVTADLALNNHGSALAAGRVLPAGVRVALVTGAGSWQASPTTLTGGYASAVLRLSRSGSVQARVDDAAVTAPVSVRAASTGPFVTLLFSRTQIATGAGCTPVPGAVPLDTGVAPELARRGLSPTGSLSPALLQETTRACGGGYSSASWLDAAQLRDRYDWTFVSHGASYSDMTTLTPAQQRAQSCGSLAAFSAHGHLRANGLFAYPGNAYSTEIQTDVVSQCFSYGRQYAGAINSRASLIAPFFQHTQSIDGGRCNLAGSPCASAQTSTTYASPDVLAARLHDLSGAQWYTLQAYRFLSGKGPDWDCTSADWHAHYTAKTEEYCWGDYLRILNAVNPATVVTDPRTVAIAFGRAHP